MNNKRLLPLTKSNFNQTKKLNKNDQRYLFKNMSIIVLYFILTINILIYNIVVVTATDWIDNDERIVLKRVAPVGKIFTIEEDKNNIIIETPVWLKVKNETINKKIYTGIPQISHLGKHLIANDEGEIQLINVVEEEKSECGEGVPTFWVEFIFDENLNDLSITEQIQKIEKIYNGIRSILKDADVSLNDFSVFSLGYLDRYHTISQIVSEDFDTKPTDHNRMIISLNISCGVLNDYASELIDAIAESEFEFRIVSGELNLHRTFVETTTRPPIHSLFRTTRQIIDNPPVAFNRLTTSQCKKGILCVISIPENTFVDAEDGTTSKLRLTIYSIDEQENFFTALPNSVRIEGISLYAGTFKFRIEARDSKNQTTSVPFQVNIEEIPRSNHEFAFTIDTTFEKFNSRNSVLRDFVYRLSASLRGVKDILPYKNAVAAASNIRINNVIESGPTQVIIKWSNTTFSRRLCQERLINETRALMLAGKNYDRVRHDFKRNMGAQFHLKKITLELFGSCYLTTSKILEGLRVRATTLETSINAEPTSTFSQTLMILLILLAVFIMFITLLTIFYCLHKKQKQKKKKQQNNFVSKGLPIVFPEEVPYEDDGIAGVTAPMLINHEQPPLDLMRVTLHENPLYKPPPTTKSVVNSTSTFTTPPPTMRILQNGTPINAIGQRLPPPYVAAI